MAKAIGSNGKTSVIYIGLDRFNRTSDMAIELSYKCRQQISPSQFAQYVLDNFTEQAKQKILSEISE